MKKVIRDSYGCKIEIGDYVLIRLFTNGFNVLSSGFEESAIAIMLSCHSFNIYARVLRVSSKKDLAHIEKIMSADRYVCQ